MDMEQELVRLTITGITYNQIENGMYALILEEEGGKLRLPIIIGYNEAQSIECILQKITTPRPLTHELIKRILESFSITVESVIIKHLSNGIFTADVQLKKGDEIHTLDARSSDAIAIAIRLDAPVLISRELLERYGVEKESFAPSANHIISNQSIPVRQAVERVRKPIGNGLSRVPFDQLEQLLTKAVEEEDYEKAGEIKQEIDRRLNKNPNSHEQKK
ncbi:MAG: bifunctional nuclease family protein [Muribaculum sp.]|nr:bifunctional nuclease family protein [Muribaculum sp.]